MFSSLLQVYKKKAEAAKKEYLKALAAYRASLVSQVSWLWHRIAYNINDGSGNWTEKTMKLLFPMKSSGESQKFSAMQFLKSKNDELWSFPLQIHLKYQNFPHFPPNNYSR